MKNNKLIWGVVLITFGVLMLLWQMNIITFSFWGILRFWPLLLIIGGINLLKMGYKAKIIASVLVSAIIIAFALIIDARHRSFGNIEDELYVDTSSMLKTHQEVLDLNTTKSAKVEMICAAGHYKIEGDNIFHNSSSTVNSNLYNFSYSSDNKNAVEVDSMGDFKIIKIEPVKDSWNILSHTMENRAKLILSSSIPYSMEIANGAVEMDADFSNVQLTSLELSSGASSSQIRLGSLSSCDIDISAGSSTISLEIPHEVGCVVSSETGLSSMKIHGFDQTNSGKYKTENYDTAANKITINIEAGVSGITIKRY